MSVLIEGGELLAVLALQNDRHAGARGSGFESAKPVVDIGQPVTALGVFAFVDDVQAGAELLPDNLGDTAAQLRLVVGGCRIEAGETRKAADMGGQNSC